MIRYTRSCSLATTFLRALLMFATGDESSPIGQSRNQRREQVRIPS
jgi:hypothetical protein